MRYKNKLSIQKSLNTKTELTYERDNNKFNVYAIVNETSTIKIYNSNIVSGYAASYNLNNSTIFFNNCIFENLNKKYVLIGNSQAYDHDLIYIKNTISSYISPWKNVIQQGSQYNYSNNIIPITIQNLKNYQYKNNYNEIKIPCIPEKIYDNKQDYQKNEIKDYVDNLGDGIGFFYDENNNMHFSAHYLSNGDFPYWSSTYCGQFTKNSNIIVKNRQQFVQVISKIPRNLNGYQVTITMENIDNLILNNFYIQDFFNGKLNIIIPKCVLQSCIIENNDCQLYIETNFIPIQIQMEDNMNIQFKAANKQFNFYSERKSIDYLIHGNNNNIIFKGDFNKNILSIFESNSIGNNINLLENNKNENIYQHLSRLNNGNMIYDQKYDGNNNIANKPALINHTHKNLNNVSSTYYNTSFRINDICPKINQDASAIGSIIGWYKENPIPRGYYICNGQTIYIDLNQYKDDYDNSQLAYLYNNSKSMCKITLPKIDECMGLIYIIKYNNVFEHYQYV